MKVSIVRSDVRGGAATRTLAGRGRLGGRYGVGRPNGEDWEQLLFELFERRAMRGVDDVRVDIEGRRDARVVCKDGGRFHFDFDDRTFVHAR
jgi:hypothetical protein